MSHLAASVSGCAGVEMRRVGRFMLEATLCVLLWTCCPWLTLTAAQICELPPGTISDVVNEHNLTVHWTEKHTHRDCALYTGDT